MENLQESMEGLRMTTVLEREAQGILHSEGLTPGAAVMAEKSGVSAVGSVPLVTNVYGVLTRPSAVYRYDVTVRASVKKEDGSLKWVDFTKKANGDAVVIDRRERCRDVFIAFQRHNREFLKQPKSIFFDMQSIMYSMVELDVKDSAGVKFDIPMRELPAEKFAQFHSCEMLVRRVDKDFQLALGDLSCVSRNLTDSEHSMAQFLDLVTSQQIMFSPNEHINFSSNSSFLLDPAAHGFSSNDDACFDDNGSYLAIGARKSVRFVEGPKRGRATALVVETKKTPFNIVETLLEKSKRIVPNIKNVANGTLCRLDTMLTGLFVETSHLGRTQRFFVRGVDPDNAATKMIEVDGSTISVQQYFQKKHNITLKEPRAPLIRAKGKDNTICYVPMELCLIVDNQRLKTQQQMPKQVQEMIKKCAVPPAILVEQNKKTFNSLHLGPDNQFLANAGVKVIDHPFALNGRQLQLPHMQYAGQEVRLNPANSTWNGRKFLVPATCQSWAAYALVSQRDRLNDREFEGFIQRFVDEANNRGMRVSPPSVVRVSDVSKLRSLIEDAARNRLKFVFVVQPDTADDVHNALKLYERQFFVITQAVRMQTLQNMLRKGQPMTLSNIIFKTNVKLGGLNFSVTINSPGAQLVLKSGTLIIGISSNHPGGGMGGQREDEGGVAQGKSSKLSAPSIVGYSANYGRVHEFEFLGDFVCQQPLREEKVEVIRQIVERCLTKYRENRKVNPKRILLYRNGASESNFAMILKYEVPLIKMTLNKNNCAAELNIIVPNKLQSVRFFPAQIDRKARPMEQNVKPGLVVDHSVVHPDFLEFYLTSHVALQGTAKTPKYTVLLNESKYSMDNFEQMTFILCYGHQIVQLPTSLPTPVYVAGRFAERGRKLYTSSTNKAAEGYADMTERLCYYGTPLSNVRVNA